MKIITSRQFRELPENGKKIIHGVPHIFRENLFRGPTGKIGGEFVPVQIEGWSPAATYLRLTSMEIYETHGGAPTPRTWIPELTHPSSLIASEPPFNFFLDPEGEEWEAAWGALREKYGSTACTDPETGEEWQFMGVESAWNVETVSSEPVWFYCFRHRSLLVQSRGCGRGPMTDWFHAPSHRPASIAARGAR